MTPPQDLLERLELLVARLDSAPAATFVQATPDLVSLIGRECIDEITRLRAELDTLRSERQPFRTLMDECARLGLLNDSLPGDRLPPEAMIEAMQTSEGREKELEHRSAIVRASEAARARALELAERLGFRKPKPEAIPLDPRKLYLQSGTFPIVTPWGPMPAVITALSDAVTGPHEVSMSIEITTLQRVPFVDQEAQAALQATGIDNLLVVEGDGGYLVPEDIAEELRHAFRLTGAQAARANAETVGLLRFVHVIEAGDTLCQLIARLQHRTIAAEALRSARWVSFEDRARATCPRCIEIAPSLVCGSRMPGELAAPVPHCSRRSGHGGNCWDSRRADGFSWPRPARLPEPSEGVVRHG